MTIEFPAIESSLSGKKILLATNHTRTAFIQEHLLTSYPPDTLMVYQQAGYILGAKVVQLTFDDMITTLSRTDLDEQFSLVINLTAGLDSIALEGILPSLASLHKIDVFPAGILSQIISGDKLVSKRIAQMCGLKCSPTHSEEDLKSIDSPILLKPIVGTDSIGIQKFNNPSDVSNIAVGYYAESFISGKDITIHVWWDKNLGSYQILDCLGTDLTEQEWFDRKMKQNANLIYNRSANNPRPHIPLSSISKTLIKNIDNFLNLIGRPFIARLDFRQIIGSNEINVDSMYFLEINSTPTISNSNDWWSGLLNASLNSKDLNFIKELDNMPIHPASKSIAFFIDAFYFQSLSIHNDS